jgi:hypothetical protein
MIASHTHRCLSGQCNGREWSCDRADCLLPSHVSYCRVCRPEAFPRRESLGPCSESSCPEPGLYRHADGFIYCARHHEANSQGEGG